MVPGFALGGTPFAESGWVFGFGQDRRTSSSGFLNHLHLFGDTYKGQITETTMLLELVLSKHI
jgi:hypothetical protein